MPSFATSTVIEATPQAVRWVLIDAAPTRMVWAGGMLSGLFKGKHAYTLKPQVGGTAKKQTPRGYP